MKSMAIWKKALLGVSFILLSNVLIFFYNIQLVQSTAEQLEQNLIQIQKLGEELQHFNYFAKELILTNVGYMDAIVDKSSAEVDEDIKAQHSKFHTEFKDNIKKTQEYLSGSVFDPNFKKDFEITIKEITVWGETAELLFASIANKDGEEKFEAYDNVLDGTLDVVLTRNQKIIDFLDGEYKELIAVSRNLQSSHQKTQWISIFVMFFLGIVTLWLLVKNVNQSLNLVTEKLIKNAQQLKIESENVSENSRTLNEASSRQASSLQETVSSVDEISSMVQRNADAANSSTRVSTKSTDVATKGRKTVDSMIGSMNEIGKSNEDIMAEIHHSNNEISQISKLIAEIGDKTKVINDIVFQTKLLSFNASVEAARAGEHGKGFAVVAEEVGNLASMSGKAALEITQMLDSSIKKVTSIVDNTKMKVEKLMKLGKEKVDHGKQTANECGESLDEILKNVLSVNDMVQEIATASAEQSTGVQEVTKAIQEIDQTNHQNAAVAAQANAMAEKLHHQADELNSAINELVLLVGGHNKININVAPGQGADNGFFNQQAKLENVIAMPENKQNGKKLSADFSKTKKVVGLETEVPASNDPRFEDL
jgi:methyl-accepting chemotaxis protein